MIRTLGMTTHLALMVVALGAMAFFGCAVASGPTGRTFAVGADAHASLYLCVAPEGIETVHENEPVFPADRGWIAELKKPSRKITDTERPSFPCELVQESQGSALLEPLAKVIGEVGVAFGTAAGRVVVCVITLGWRCGP